MGISVIVEPITGHGYRAIGAGGLSVGLTAEGATADEAIDRLAGLVQSRLDSGARLTELSVDSDASPWGADAGYLRNCPSYQDWLDAMAERRRLLDEDPESR